jgi:chorismate-pyruvate lyase
MKNWIEMKLTNILLNADGSTTRLLETLIGDKVTVNVHQQGFFPKDTLPLEPTRYFNSDGPYLYRIMSLYYRDEPISNNVVIAAKSALDGKLQQDLIKGRVPLGKLINGTENRRELISAQVAHSSAVQKLFYTFKLEDDVFPIKQYLIVKSGESWFYICEVFHYKTIYEYFMAGRKDMSKSMTTTY